MPLRLKRTWEIMTGQREPVTAGDAEGADRGQGNNADTSHPQAPDADGVDVSLRITGWKRTGVAIRTAVTKIIYLVYLLGILGII
eukprot:1193521-Prorocentrum_minimum.AAC.6